MQAARKSFILLVFATLLFTGCRNNTANKQTHCVIRTELGDISVRMEDDRAPATVENFLAYVDGGRFDSTTFFRVCNPANEAGREIMIDVIQGGDVPEADRFPPIEIETTEMTGLKHIDGVISMARSEPNTAQSSYFICIGDQPELDHGGKRNPDGYGFAAFGQVTQGMDVVRRIHQLPDSGQYLLKPVVVLGIDRVIK